MIAPANTAFVLLSFEGPDGYSNAGGLGVRVTELSEALATEGYETQLHFVGDPQAPYTEETTPNRVLFRWAQPVSQRFPRGVYHGEWRKMEDLNYHLPLRMAEEIIPDLLSRRERVVILAEEWHMAEAVCNLTDRLWERGLLDRSIRFWNANANIGFEHVNWNRLGFTGTQITTVSRYMKFILWDHGVDALVIPNGIPARLLEPVPKTDASRLRSALRCKTLLTKVGRWDPNKRWQMAVEAVALAKATGLGPTLVARGGIEPHEQEVLQHSYDLGLSVREVWLPEGAEPTFDACIQAIARSEPGDFLLLRFFVPERLLRALYHASDATLANSGREPFGLVGLEAMACKGVVFTGSTGEEYAQHLMNAIVLNTSDPAEIVYYLQQLRREGAVRRRLIDAGYKTAKGYVWNNIIKLLNDKLEMTAGWP